MSESSEVVTDAVQPVPAISNENKFPNRAEKLWHSMKQALEKPKQTIENFDPIRASKSLLYEMIEASSPTGLNKWTSIYGMVRFVSAILIGLVYMGTSIVNDGNMLSFEFLAISFLTAILFAFWWYLQKQMSHQQVRTLMMGAISTVEDQYEQATLTLVVNAIQINAETAYQMLSSLSDSGSRLTGVFRDRLLYAEERRGKSGAFQKKRSMTSLTSQVEVLKSGSNTDNENLFDSLDQTDMEPGITKKVEPKDLLPKELQTFSEPSQPPLE